MIIRAVSPSTINKYAGEAPANNEQFVQTGLAAGTYVYHVYAYNKATGTDSALSNAITAVVQ